MNTLLDNLTKFINTVIELYPLPYQLTTDLHTLNAYLRSYSQNQQTLLQAFVGRQVQKLDLKLRKHQQKEHSIQTSEQSVQENMFLTKKYSGLKLQIPTELSECLISENRSCLEKNQSGGLSQRSGRSVQNNGIKTERHKFGTRERNKTQKTLEIIRDKENISSKGNLKIEDLNEKSFKLPERSLKFIKSQAALLHNVSQGALPRQNSTQTRRDDANRLRVRYESHQNRNNPNPSLLKIKLKSKQTLDLIKIKEGIYDVFNKMQTDTAELNSLLKEMEPEQQRQNMFTV